MEDHKHTEDRYMKALKAHEERELIVSSNLLKEIQEFREEIKPMLDLYINSRGFFNTFTWLLKFAAIVAAGVAAVLFLRKL